LQLADEVLEDRVSPDMGDEHLSVRPLGTQPGAGLPLQPKAPI
jgi:hypothetical protein